MSRAFSSLVMALCLVVFSAQSQAAELVDRVVAVVNGQLITLFELNEKLEKLLSQAQGISISPNDPEYVELQRRVLDSMINDILIKQAAEKLGITVSETEIVTKINELKKQNGMNEEQFRKQLAQEGLTRKEFEKGLETEAIKHQLLGFMVNKRILVTDEELQQYYDQMGGNIPDPKANLTRRTPGTIGFIMVGSMAEAESLRQKIASGQMSFADAARKHSIGPGREQGGELGGDVVVEDLAPPLRAALQETPAGQVTKPISLEGKAVLLIRKDKGDVAAAAAEPAPATTSSQSFQQARAQIYEMLFRAKFEKLFQEYMNDLRSKAVVDVRL
ncbi:MAG: SurA N-terminal domain-containing protein [Desulfovibrionaceae bacterium]|nr:SurA N-terminal domain-containing protein [Desulfovibrionaceae bacterium]